MTIQALNIALSGLRVAKQSLDITSNNIANAGVEGYTRKILPQYTSMGTEGTFFGVVGGEIRRDMNFALRRDLWNQNSIASYLETRVNYLERIQTFHGASDAESSISASVSQLKDAFAELASSPENPFLQGDVLNQAQQTASDINGFATFLNNTRNDAQNEIVSVVQTINELLSNVNTLNQAIKNASTAGQSTAALEDERDQAIKALAQQMDISHYTRGDGAIVIQTKGGTPLVDDTLEQLFFNPITLNFDTTGTPVYLNDPSGLDFTTIEVGGRLGALLELRDETLPAYQAQLDEFSHKLALRFDAQGMRLFTDATGNVPGMATVDYLGFSTEFQVNPNILADPSLLRDGTEPTVNVGEASSDVIQKVLDFTFGQYQSLEALGNVDISGGGDLFTLLGISATATTAGNTDITAIGALDTHPDINPGDTLTLQLGAAPPVNITINPGDTATNLLATINGAMGPNLTASLGSNGELVLTGDDDITVGLGSISAAGLSALGLTTGTTTAQDPSFNIELSTGGIQTVSISAADTGASLVATLNAIPGLTAALDGSGFLQLTPEFGGDLKLTDNNGSGVISALGMSFSQIGHDAMQTTGLGASGTISTNLTSSDFIEEYGRRIITDHANTYNDAERSLGLEGEYKDILQKKITDNYGVDIDEEVAFLIQVQTNYSAAARVIEAARELFDELLNAF